MPRAALGKVKTKIELGVIRKCRKRDIDPKRPKLRTCLYDRFGKKLLGRHIDRESALRQERWIQIRKKIAARQAPATHKKRR